MTKNIAVSLILIVSTLFAPLTTFAKEDAKKCTQTGISFVNSEQRTTFPFASSSEIYTYTTGTAKNEGLVFNILTTFTYPSSVSYGGKQATLVSNIVDDVGNRLSTWRLESPKSGTNEILVTGLLASNYLEVNILEYAGVDQKNMDDGHNSLLVPNGGSITLTQTTHTPNAWVMSFVRNQSIPVMVASTGVGATRTSGIQSSVGDTNGPVVIPGNYSMTWTSSDFTYADWGNIMAIKPAKQNKENEDAKKCTQTGISFVNSEQRTTFPFASSSEIYSYTVGTAKNEGLVFNILTVDTRPSSVSYGGKQATLVASIVDNVGIRLSTWRLEDPKTGSNPIVVTGLSASNYLEVNILEYSGVNQKNMDDGHGSLLVPNGGSITLNQITHTPNAWVMSFARNQSIPIMTASTGVGATRASGIQSSVGDTDAPVATPGNYSMTWTSADSVYGNWGIIMAIKPAK